VSAAEVVSAGPTAEEDLNAVLPRSADGQALSLAKIVSAAKVVSVAEVVNAAEVVSNGPTATEDFNVVVVLPRSGERKELLSLGKIVSAANVPNDTATISCNGEQRLSAGHATSVNDDAKNQTKMPRIFSHVETACSAAEFVSLPTGPATEMSSAAAEILI
jgi:hypothetical protein